LVEQQERQRAAPLAATKVSQLVDQRAGRWVEMTVEQMASSKAAQMGERWAGRWA